MSLCYHLAFVFGILRREAAKKFSNNGQAISSFELFELNGHRNFLVLVFKKVFYFNSQAFPPLSQWPRH